MIHGNRKATLALLGLVLSAGFMAAPAAVHAFQIVPTCATQRGEAGKPVETPSLNCALQTFGNIAQFILGITGSFALLMFVYGGFTMLTSAGSPDKVAKGKTILTNALIGIVIIFSSGTLISYGLNQIGVSSALKVIGTECDAQGGVKGTFFEVSDGKDGVKVVCAAKCEQIDGYACRESTTDADNCITGLCEGGVQRRCCQTTTQDQ